MPKVKSELSATLAKAEQNDKLTVTLQLQLQKQRTKERELAKKLSKELQAAVYRECVIPTSGVQLLQDAARIAY